jgi:predicted aldo/keto reductase-like oxidoreductase
MVPALSLGTGTFGGTNAFFERWGTTGVAEATRLVDLCIDAGVTFFDTANSCSEGAAVCTLSAALPRPRRTWLWQMLAFLKTTIGNSYVFLPIAALRETDRASRPRAVIGWCPR